MKKKKLMIHVFLKMKQEGCKIAWLTSYDFPTTQFAEAAGMEMILVGDSLVLEDSDVIRKAMGLTDVVRFEHHITETWKSIVRQPYLRQKYPLTGSTP
mgnify:CR=1 FL=1